MLIVEQHQVTPALAALFDLSRPTMLRAMNVLEGHTRGTILADDPDHPRVAAVYQQSFGTLYLGGRFDAPLLAKLVARCRQLGGVGIGCWPENELNALLPPNPAYDGRALFFAERDAQVPLEPLAGALPQGYTLAERDARLLAQSLDLTDTLAAFGSMEAILQHTLGVVALRDGVVCCEAATGAPVNGQIEVGVTTLEAHRRRGLAAGACARLIGMCEARGLATWWDCAGQNVASAQLAHTLGYRHGREYRYAWWPKLSWSTRLPMHDDQIARVRRICLALPESGERLSHGEPTFFVGKKVFVMFANNHHGDGRVAVWLPVPPGFQADLIAEAPALFFRPPYVGVRGWVGIVLERIGDADLEMYIRLAWDLVAPPRVRARAARPASE